MRADIKTLYKLSLLLGALIIILLALKFVPTNTPIAQPPEQIEQVYAIDMSVSDVLGVAIENEGGVMTLISTPDGMEVSTAHGEVAFDPEVFKSIYYGLCHVPAVALQEDTQVDISTPLATVIYLEQSGETKQYILSDTRGPQGEFYIQDAQSGAVYLIEAATGERFLITQSDLQSLSVLPPITSENINSIQSVSVTDHTNPEKSYSVQTDHSGDLILYSFTSPINLRVDWNSVWDRIIVPLSRVYGEEIVSDIPSITQPDYTVSVTMDGTEHVVHIDIQDDLGYIESQAQQQVMSISPDELTFLSENYEDFLGGNIFGVTPSFLDSILLQSANSDYMITVQQDEQGVVTLVGQDGLQISQQDIDALSNIPVNTRFLGADLSSSPTLTVIYNYKNGVMDRLEFVDLHDGSQIAVRYNDEVFYTTFTSVVEDIITLVN